ncbi:sulfatase family protein [Pedobacter yulinensis]|nr:sulfatase [Pedobacter yulinensis]
MKRFLYIILLLTCSCAIAQDRPNILWLVCEDMSPYLSCYGNTTIQTPNLDALAGRGIRFTRAHSNGAQCSPSRSTLISGVYAVSLGTDIHREKRPFPAAFYFPKYLRQSGYYTSNNAKQDYNNEQTPPDVWNEQGNKAGYASRIDKTKPFFAVFNCGITHMSRVATHTTNGRTPRSVSPQAVRVPAYVPDLPAVRDDIAWNMDAVVMMDQWVGKKLQELERSGEAANTIIFFYSDHGGTVPRGKAYTYESGTHVPFLVSFPKKWAHLAGQPQPATNNRLFSFVDLAPTVLQLAGVEKPTFMKGASVFGGTSNPYIFTFRANQGDSFCPSRAISDGRFKLIRNFQSAYPNGTRQDYQWQMPAQQAWDQAFTAGKLNAPHQKFWRPVEPFELYDLHADSLETNNLAENPTFKGQLVELRTELERTMRRERDLGVIPREYRKGLQARGPLYTLAQTENWPVGQWIAAAEKASMCHLPNVPELMRLLADKDPVLQYWGASGICGLAKAGRLKKIPAAATALIDSKETMKEAKCLLAEALVYTGSSARGLAYLYGLLAQGYGPAGAALQNTGAAVAPVRRQLEQLLQHEKRARYRFYIRSCLINCGALPYAALYPPGEKIGD